MSGPDFEREALGPLKYVMGPAQVTATVRRCRRVHRGSQAACTSGVGQPHGGSPARAAMEAQERAHALRGRRCDLGAAY